MFLYYDERERERERIGEMERGISSTDEPIVPDHLCKVWNAAGSCTHRSLALDDVAVKVTLKEYPEYG